MFGFPINDSILNSLYRYSDTVSMQLIRKAEQSLRKGNFILSPTVSVSLVEFISLHIRPRALPLRSPAYNTTKMNNHARPIFGH